MVFTFGGSNERLRRSVMNFASGWTEYTVASWIKSDVTGTDRGWFNLEDPDNLDKYGSVRYDVSGDGGGGTNVMKFGIDVAGAGNVTCESASGVQTTSLQHVVARWKSGSQAEIWIDGVITAHTNQDSSQVGGIDTGYNRIILGLGPQDDMSNEGWDGIVYEHRVYQRYLSQAEIETLFACRGTDNITLNLELKYGNVTGTFGVSIPMITDLIKDLSGNAQHLTESGDPVFGASVLTTKRKIL